MKRTALGIIALLLVAAPLAHAKVRTDDTAKIQMDVPDGWKAGGKGNVFTVADPTDEVGLIFITMEASDIQKAANGLDAELAKIATDIKWKSDKPAPLKLNGMDAIANKGTAKVGGKDADIAVMLVKTPSGKALLIFGAVESAKKEAHQAEVAKFLNSIKPAP